LLVSRRRLKKQRLQPEASVLGSSTDKIFFRSSEAKYDRKTVQRIKLFISARKENELGQKSVKCPGHEAR
jgi:hypothetical protein